MNNVLNTISKYTFFYITKVITSYSFLLVLKTVETISVSLRFRKPKPCII